MKHIIIDVRTLEEFEQGHLSGAININFYDSDFQEKILKLDKEYLYSVYCRSGNRASETIKIMKSLGFNNVKLVLI